MPLILHIGLPKSGTTYLQKTFDAARAVLARRGFDYPDAGYYNHQVALYEPLGPYLPWTARPGLPERWQALAPALTEEDGQVTLVSAEALSALDAAGVEALKRLVVGRPLQRIIVTTRPLLALLPSHWQQNLKQGADEELANFADRALGQIEAGEEPGQMYCHRRTVERWQRLFPGTPISVLKMTGDFGANLQMFARMCGLDAEAAASLNAAVPPASEQNLSLSVDECRKLRAINAAIVAGRMGQADRRRAIAIFFKQRDRGLLYDKPQLDDERVARAEAIDAWADAVEADVTGQPPPGRAA